MKKRIKIAALITCTVISAGIILCLYAMSPISKDIYRGEFKRDFEGGNLNKMETLDATYNSFYIAGIDSSSVYFGNSTAPFHLLITNHSLLDSLHVRLQVNIDSIVSPKEFRLTVDAPYFYLTHGRAGRYLRGDIGNWTSTDFLGDSVDYSVESIPLSKNTIVLKSYSTETNGYELALKNFKTGLRFNFKLLNSQVDGVFSLDGKMAVDPVTKNIVYIHYYRNEVVVADSSLNLLLRGSTLDTFRTANVKVTKIKSTGEQTMSAPTNMINLSSCAYGDRLFVKSNLMSADELPQFYVRNTVIDVYDLRTMNYMRSFYIPDIDGEKTTSFSVFKNKLFAVTGKNIVSYMMPPDIAEPLKP